MESGVNLFDPFYRGRSFSQSIQLQNKQMQDLTIFNYEHSEIRVFSINGEPYWSVAELRIPLGYSEHTKTSEILDKVDDLDKLKLDYVIVDSFDTDVRLGGNTPCGSNLVGTWVVNESGLYALIFGSKKEEAKKFKRWVTSEVLPTIRKTGAYQIEKKDDLVLKMLVDINNRMDNLNCQLAETNAKYDNLQTEKLQLLAENTELVEFKEDVEVYSEFMYLLDVAKNEIGQLAYSHGVSCKEYLLENNIPLDQEAWCTLSRRTASFYRSTKGRDPERRGNHNVYRCKDVAYIVATIRLIMKGK